MPQRENSAIQQAQPETDQEAINAQHQNPKRRNWFYLHARAVEYTSFAISGLLGLTLSAMANTNMSIAVWTTFSAVIFAALGGACWWQKYLWDADARAQSSPPPQQQLEQQPKSAPSMSNEQNINSSNQSGGFIGVNQGTVNFGYPNTDAKLNEILARMNTYQKQRTSNLSKEFPLGYSLFTMKGQHQIIPYKMLTEPIFIFKWETASVEGSGVQ